MLCALILAFIFLTPPIWFATGERTRGLEHQNSSQAARVLLPWSDDLPTNPGTDELERRARELTGHSDLRVRGARLVRGEGGHVVAYEVDIE